MTQHRCTELADEGCPVCVKKEKPWLLKELRLADLDYRKKPAWMKEPTP